MESAKSEDEKVQEAPATPIVVKKKSSRNTEKRRERSKVAARCRRGKESEIFTELSNCLPVSESSKANMDKASIMRLTLCDLKLRKMMENVEGFRKKSKTDNTSDVQDADMFDALINTAVAGFVLVCSCDGEVVYVSEGVASCLGLSQYEIMGLSLLEFSHPCDQGDVKEMLSSVSTSSSNKSTPSQFVESRTALFRMKSANSTRGRNVHHRSTNYKVVACCGRIFSGDDSAKDAVDPSKEWFVGVCEPLLHPSDVDIPLNKQTFLSKHSPDMKFEYVDDSISEFMGYKPEDLTGKSLLDFYHACDGDGISRSFRSLYSKGQTVTERSRFLAKGGGWIWVVTQATCINNNAGKPTSVVCIHFVTSGVECPDNLVSHVQLRGADDSYGPQPKQVVCAAPNMEKKPLQETTNLRKSAAAPIKQRSTTQTPEEATPEPLLVNPFTGPILSKPTPSTAKIFTPRTDDMDTGFLMPVNDGLIVTKGEPADLTHLAPIAGDECVPLSNVPLLDDLLQWLDAADMEYMVLEGYEEPLPLPLISAATGSAIDSPIPMTMTSCDAHCPIVKDDVVLGSNTNSPHSCGSPLLISSTENSVHSPADAMLLSPFKTPSPEPISSTASPLCMDMMNSDAFSSYYSDNPPGGILGGGSTAGCSSHKSKAGGGYDDEKYARYSMLDYQLSPGKCFDDIGPPSKPSRLCSERGVGTSLTVSKLGSNFESDNPGGHSIRSSAFPRNRKDPDTNVGRLKYLAACCPDPGPSKIGTQPSPHESGATDAPLPCKVAKSTYINEQGSSKAWRQVASITPHQPPWKVEVPPPRLSPPFQVEQQHHPFRKRFLSNAPIVHSSSSNHAQPKPQYHYQRLRQLHKELLTNPSLVQALIMKGKLKFAHNTSVGSANSRKRNFVGKLIGNGGLLSNRFVYGSSHMSGDDGNGGGILDIPNASLVELTNQDCEVNAPLSQPLLNGPELITALDTGVTGGAAECL